MQVKNGPRSRCASRGERAPTEQRMKVVSVDHVGSQAPDGGAYLLGIESARHQTTRGRCPAGRLARAL